MEELNLGESRNKNEKWAMHRLEHCLSHRASGLEPLAFLATELAQNFNILVTSRIRMSPSIVHSQDRRIASLPALDIGSTPRPLIVP